MNTLIVACIFISLSMSMALNCYKCSAGSGGCSDPFNATGSGVTKTGTNNTNAYCSKISVAGIVRRDGSESCTATRFVLNSGQACCQTDLCNGIPVNNPLSIVMIVGLLALLAKIQWE